MPTTLDFVKTRLRESFDVQMALLQTSEERITEIADRLIKAVREGHTIYLIGNAGSAMIAQQWAAALMGYQRRPRAPIPAIALGVDAAILRPQTSLSDGIGMDEYFSRQVSALVKPGDVLIAISASGDATNILHGVEAAHQKGAVTIGLTGESGACLREAVDCCFDAPASDYSLVKECHQTVAHIVTDALEEELFEETPTKSGTKRRKKSANGGASAEAGKAGS